MTSLTAFRAHPLAVAPQTSFLVDTHGYTPTDISDHFQAGGQVCLNEGTSENGVIRLTIGAVTQASCDYYFPWVNRGVGVVEVPKAAPNGTIVATAMMNGCALMITDANADTLNFYHDADCNSLERLQVQNGTQIQTVAPKHYMSSNYGQRRCIPAPGEPPKGLAFGHQLLAVRHDNQWYVFNFGFIIGPGLDTPIVEAYHDGPTGVLAPFA